MKITLLLLLLLLHYDHYCSDKYYNQSLTKETTIILDTLSCYHDHVTAIVGSTRVQLPSRQFYADDHDDADNDDADNPNPKP